MRQTIAAAFIATCALISGGHTQDYPTRPVTMVVPFAAGGPTDVLARVVADRMGQLLGQQVVVENVGGAGGMTGVQRVAQAPPDGYTIGLGTVGT
ncbi:MAG: tripartite tricarboxylate transporter substrate-binding protein, partial [Xanthobacteraceae bacterium]